MSEPPCAEDLHFYINKQQRSAEISGNTVIFDLEDQYGISMLSMRNKSNKRVEIKDVLVDGQSLRSLIYLSWMIDSQQVRHQPATTLWEQDQTWYLPFGRPLSFWHTLVSRKIGNQRLGKNLDEFYWIRYPEPFYLDQHWPQIMRDFMRHDFDFLCVPKSQGIDFLPWIETDINIDCNLKIRVIDEIQAHRQEINNNKKTYEQYRDNKTDLDINDSRCWITFFPRSNWQWKIQTQEWPAVMELFNSLDLRDVYSMMIGILPAGGIIAPHIDDHWKAPNLKDLGILYMPLIWPRGNIFKFAGCPLIKDDATIIINTRDYVHALVNDSEQERLIVTFAMEKLSNPQIFNSSVMS